MSHRTLPAMLLYSAEYQRSHFYLFPHLNRLQPSSVLQKNKNQQQGEGSTWIWRIKVAAHIQRARRREEPRHTPSSRGSRGTRSTYIYLTIVCVLVWCTHPRPTDRRSLLSSTVHTVAPEQWAGRKTAALRNERKNADAASWVNMENMKDWRYGKDALLFSLGVEVI